MVPEPEPLDTAGGVRAAVDQVRGSFLVLNGDILTDVDYREVVAAHRDAGADATLVLTRVEDTSSYGVCVREGTRITEFVEKPAPGTLPGQDAINAGTYVLEPDVLAGFEPGRLSFERQVFPAVLARGGHLEGVVWDGVWADLGTPERYLEGHRLALSGAMSWPSVDEVADRGGGVRVAADASVAADAVLTGPVLILAGARVDGGATVGPDVVVGAGSTVGPGATVSDSVLFERVHLGADVAGDRPPRRPRRHRRRRRAPRPWRGARRRRGGRRRDRPRRRCPRPHPAGLTLGVRSTTRGHGAAWNPRAGPGVILAVAAFTLCTRVNR